ncbi:MAG: phosphatase PAP2 family protein [Porphyromonadaceae bacterium]|nr:phosphatase PAP2 family protein [Porphyromonadaceae bacterium]
MKILIVLLSILLILPILVLNAQELDSVSLKSDSVVLSNKKENIKITHFIIPAALITFGFVGLKSDGLKLLNASIQKEIHEHNPSFDSNIDNFTQYIPGASVFMLNALGINGKHSWKDAALIYGGSIVITSAFVFPIKYITQVERPDGSSKDSFPSGHTATAFAAAEFLRREYWEVSPWIGVTGYAMAATTGILRMYNDRHWLTDVVAGAGFGIASTTLSYLIYDELLKKNHSAYIVTPTFNGGVGLSLVKNF